MSQHDMDLANQAGASFRSDLNNALGALVTLSSGAAAPTTTFAHMLWADTTTGIVKQRNAANTAWINRWTTANAEGLFEGSSPGVNLEQKVNNTSNTANSAAVMVAQVAGSSGGNAFNLWTVSGVNSWAAGIDNSDNDSWKLGQGTSPNTNETIIARTSGEFTLPRQVAFQANNSAQDVDQTGDGTNYTIICDNEVFDQNADYNAGTGVFTAPVTGRYQLMGAVNLAGLAAGHTSCTIRITTSNRNYERTFNAAAIMVSGEIKMEVSFLCDMDAADTATLNVIVSGSTKVVDINATDTKFAGLLEC